MALRFVDSVLHYSDAYTKWNLYGSYKMVVSSSTPRQSGGKSLTPENFYAASIKVLGNQGTWIVGHAVRMTGGNQLITSFWDVVSPQIHVYTNSDGKLSVKSSTTLGTTTLAIMFNQWYFIEVKVVIHSSSGSVEIRVNGITWLSISGVNTSYTGNNYANGIGVGDPTSSTWGNNAGQLHTDWYACDATGSVNNDFLGDCAVELLLPTGAGAETQWTPSAGANWQNVDDNPPDNDTTYNGSNTVGQVDTYAMGNLATGSGLIYGVQYLELARKDNAGTRTVAPVARIGGTDYPGSNVNLNDSYLYLREVQEKSPATNAAWTISEINAMEAGIKVTA